jgi:hypothetical protein
MHTLQASLEPQFNCPCLHSSSCCCCCCCSCHVYSHCLAEHIFAELVALRAHALCIAPLLTRHLRVAQGACETIELGGKFVSCESNGLLLRQAEHLLLSSVAICDCDSIRLILTAAERDVQGREGVL